MSEHGPVIDPGFLEEDFCLIGPGHWQVPCPRCGNLTHYIPKVSKDFVCTNRFCRLFGSRLNQEQFDLEIDLILLQKKKIACVKRAPW